MNALEEQFEVIKALLRKWPDEKRHPLVADSADWDEITPAIVSLGNLQGTAIQANNMSLLVASMEVDRCIYEAVYCMGYERGKKSRPMPAFVVAEEENED